MKLDWNGFWSVAPSSHETKTEWSLVIRTELTPKEVTEFSLRLQLSAWTSTRLFDLSVSLPNSPGVLGNNQENLMKHKIKHLTKIPWMHYQKRWKRSFNCNRCWNMWSLNSRADVCHMRWPVLLPMKHCVCDPPVWPQRTCRKTKPLCKNSNVDIVSLVTKNEVKCEMSLGNS